MLDLALRDGFISIEEEIDLKGLPNEFNLKIAAAKDSLDQAYIDEIRTVKIKLQEE